MWHSIDFLVHWDGNDCHDSRDGRSWPRALSHSHGRQATTFGHHLWGGYLNLCTARSQTINIMRREQFQHRACAIWCIGNDIERVSTAEWAFNQLFVMFPWRQASRLTIHVTCAVSAAGSNAVTTPGTTLRARTASHTKKSNLTLTKSL